MSIPFDPLRATAVFASAFVASAINSVAGAGTLITFPTLLWAGLDSVTANATSTVGIWPGSVGTVGGYRQELRGVESRFRILIWPSLVGGLIGALMLRWTPSSSFDKIVPYLVLFATLLFMVQETMQRMLKTAARHKSAKWLAGAVLFQFGVGIYGGYFGAGIGILMLAALGILGMKDIHEMNALKGVLGGAINGVAMAYFIVVGMVYWPHVIVMSVGSIAGGWGGAGLARKIGRRVVRWIVIAVGFGMSVALYLRR